MRKIDRIFPVDFLFLSGYNTESNPTYFPEVLKMMKKFMLAFLCVLLLCTAAQAQENTQPETPAEPVLAAQEKKPKKKSKKRKWIIAAIIAGVLALKIAPHALRRFTIWRHVWEDPLGRGYQQTRSLMCLASGGMLGLGAGNGWMKKLFASDTDVVFATVAEEWGLLASMMMVAAIVILAVFCLRSAVMGRSSFYTIGACTAVSILLAQTILNVMGTVDLLPFTGVTFPFVSNGGTSMIGAWGLLAFVKAADTRQNASFAVRLGKRGGRCHELYAQS